MTKRRSIRSQGAGRRFIKEGQPCPFYRQAPKTQHDEPDIMAHAASSTSSGFISGKRPFPSQYLGAELRLAAKRATSYRTISSGSGLGFHAYGRLLPKPTISANLAKSPIPRSHAAWSSGLKGTSGNWELTRSPTAFRARVP